MTDGLLLPPPVTTSALGFPTRAVRLSAQDGAFTYNELLRDRVVQFYFENQAGQRFFAGTLSKNTHNEGGRLGIGSPKIIFNPEDTFKIIYYVVDQNVWYVANSAENPIGFFAGMHQKEGSAVSEPLEALRLELLMLDRNPGFALRLKGAIYSTVPGMPLFGRSDHTIYKFEPTGTTPYHDREIARSIIDDASREEESDYGFTMPAGASILGSTVGYGAAGAASATADEDPILIAAGSMAVLAPTAPLPRKIQRSITDYVHAVNARYGRETVNKARLPEMAETLRQYRIIDAGMLDRALAFLQELYR